MRFKRSSFLIKATYVFMVLLLLQSVFMPSLAGAAADGEAPVIEDIKVSPNEVGAGGTVKVTAKITDDNSGVSSAGIHFRSPGNNPSIPIYLDYNKETDLWEGSHTISSYAENGEWKFYYFWATDYAGNNAEIYGSDVANISDLSFTVKPELNVNQPEDPYYVTITEETWGNRVIDKDVYIGPDSIIEIQGNVEITGDVYVYGIVRSYGDVTINGTLHAKKITEDSFGYWDKGTFLFLEGTNNVEDYLVTDEPYKIPFDIYNENLTNESGTVEIEGKTLPFIDVLVQGESVSLDSRGLFKVTVNNITTDEVQFELKDSFGNIINKAVEVKDVIAPVKVVDFQVEKNSGDAIEVSWTPNNEEDVAGYHLFLNNEKVDEVAAGITSYIFTELEEDTDYTLSIAAVDRSGNVSEKSEVAIQTNLKSQLDRISGYMRYDTAIEVSKRGWDAAETVILARGDDFADALAGVPLAYKLDAPILMTPVNKLWDNTLTEIERLGAKNVIVLGGKGAVSDTIVNKLVNDGLKVRRIAGSSRFDTAALIASEMAPKGTDKVIVANGMDFPDALSVASQAAKEGLPILLTMDDRLPAATTAKVKQLAVKETIVVGGKSVVSEKTKAQLPKPVRLSGSDRYKTNIAIAEHFGVESKHLYVATGQNYADALTGAVLAAKDDSTILLVHHKVPAAVESFLKKQQPDSLSIFGGESAVSKVIENELKKQLP